MKFRKTAVAVALASMVAAPLAQADVTLSGYIGIILEGSDEDDIDVFDDDGAFVEELRPGDPEFTSDDSSLNIAASAPMFGGLTAYGNYRLDSGLTGSTPAGDNVWIGFRGGFGDVRIGEVPDATEYGQVANDALFDIGGEDAGISYTGVVGPVTFGANWSPQNNSDRTAVGVKFGAFGFGIGIGVADDDGDTLTSVGASFGIAGFSIAGAFKDFDNDFESVGIQIGYGIAGVSLNLTIEDGTGDANDDESIVRFDVGYGLGGGMNVSGRVDSIESAGVEDVVAYRVLLSKSF